MSERSRSEEYLARARALMPGGVNSPVRAYTAVGGDPVVVAEAAGSRVRDLDGREYIDYVCSWGPLILGHAAPETLCAVQQQATRGLSFGAPSEPELALAERVVARMPWIERVRFVTSGTEATMSALRVARAATRRDGVLKFAGCYHGHVDALLVQAGSGVATLGLHGQPGVPDAYASLTSVCAFNDVAGTRAAIRAQADRLAAVIVEPIAANMGVVPPVEGFLAMLREETARAGIVLIFDEVITGFRVASGGAVEWSGVTPDMVTLGKIIGGGLPVGAYGGRADLLARVAPEGDVYQAGTLAGNPIAMAAGWATLEALIPAAYEQLEERSAALADGLADAAQAAGARVTIARVASLLTVFFTEGPVANYADASRADTAAFARFFHAMRKAGVLLPPSQYEAWFVSTAHTREDIDRTVDTARDAFRAVTAVHPPEEPCSIPR